MAKKFKADDVVLRKRVWTFTSDDDNGHQVDVFSTEAEYLDRIKGQLESTLEVYTDDDSEASLEVRRLLSEGEIEEAFEYAREEQGFFDNLDYYYTDTSEVVVRRSELDDKDLGLYGEESSAEHRFAKRMRTEAKKVLKKPTGRTEEDCLVAAAVGVTFRWLFATELSDQAKREWVLVVLRQYAHFQVRRNLTFRSLAEILRYRWFGKIEII